MWIEYSNNPCARHVGDCAVRAIALALGVDWEDAYVMLADAGLAMCDLPNSNATIDAVLRMNGFYKEMLPATRHDTYTAEDFCRDNPIGVYVLGFGTHVTTVIDGDIYDIWDCSKEIPQYFWVR